MRVCSMSVATFFVLSLFNDGYVVWILIRTTRTLLLGLTGVRACHRDAGLQTGSGDADEARWLRGIPFFVSGRNEENKDVKE